MKEQIIEEFCLQANRKINCDCKDGHGYCVKKNKEDTDCIFEPTDAEIKEAKKKNLITCVKCDKKNADTYKKNSCFIKKCLNNLVVKYDKINKVDKCINSQCDKNGSNCSNGFECTNNVCYACQKKNVKDYNLNTCEIKTCDNGYMLGGDECNKCSQTNVIKFMKNSCQIEECKKGYKLDSNRCVQCKNIQTVETNEQGELNYVRNTCEPNKCKPTHYKERTLLDCKLKKDDDVKCKFEEECKSGICAGKTTEKKCTSLKKNQSCDDTNKCKDGSSCRGNICLDKIKPESNGIYPLVKCDKNENCDNNNCVKNVKGVQKCSNKPALKGEICNLGSDQNCDKQLFCNPEGICVEKKKQGVSCSDSKECKSNICGMSLKVCLNETGELNDRCDFSNKCGPGLFCDEKGLKGKDKKNTCQLKIPKGNITTNCVDDNNCMTNSCAGDLGKKICTDVSNSIKTNGSCDKTHLCDQDNYCDNFKCKLKGKCADTSCPDCQKDEQCGKNHFCIKGKCSEKKKNQTCDNTNVTGRCIDDLRCINNVCKEKLDVYVKGSNENVSDCEYKDENCKAGSICVSMGSTSKCSKKDINMPCNDENACINGLLCIDNICANKKDSGILNNCQLANHCKSNKCLGRAGIKSCSDGKEGQSCNQSSNCKEKNNYCNEEKKCVKKSSVGQECNSNLSCLSGKCNLNTQKCIGKPSKKNEPCNNSDDCQKIMDDPLICNNITFTCTTDTFKCVNGTPIKGLNKNRDDKDNCEKCDKGYKLQGKSCVKVSLYKCPNGTPVSGEKKPNTSDINCASCDRTFGLHKNPSGGNYICAKCPKSELVKTFKTKCVHETCIEGSEIREKTNPDGSKTRVCTKTKFICPNGTVKEGTYDENLNQVNCKICKTGFTLKPIIINGQPSSQKECICDNSANVAKDGFKPGTCEIQKCEDFYSNINNKCEKNKFICPNGVVDSSADKNLIKTQTNILKCSSCNDGFNLKTINGKKHCVCDNSDGVKENGFTKKPDGSIIIETIDGKKLCKINSTGCKINYKLTNGKCECDNKVENSNKSCIDFKCNDGHFLLDNKCNKCTNFNVNVATWSTNNTCEIKACKTGYNLVNNECINDKIKTCSDGFIKKKINNGVTPDPNSKVTTPPVTFECVKKIKNCGTCINGEINESCNVTKDCKSCRSGFHLRINTTSKAFECKLNVTKSNSDMFMKVQNLNDPYFIKLNNYNKENMHILNKLVKISNPMDNTCINECEKDKHCIATEKIPNKGCKLIYHIGKELNKNNNIKSNYMFIKKEINLCTKGSRFINSKCEVCPNKNNIKTYEQNSCVVKECNTGFKLSSDKTQCTK